MNFEDTNKEKKVDINNLLKNKKVIIGVAAAVILLLIIALSTSATKIDLGKYFSSNIEVSGVDGHAKIEEGDFYDYDALFDELTTLASGKSIGEVLNAQDEVERSISFSYSVNGKKVEVLEKLSNGDEITIEVMSSLKKSEFFKAKFNNGQTKFKVEGLEKGIEVDAFDLSKIEIRCVGANGYGRVVVNKMNEDDFPIDITYVIEDNEGLKNGDKVTIEAQIGDYSSSFEQYYLKKEKIEYEVKDLLEVAKSAKDFTTSDLEKLKSAAMPKMNGKFFLIAHNTDQVVFDSMILSVATEPSGVPNTLYVIGTYVEDGETESKYLVVSCEKILYDSNGNFSYNGKTEITEDIFTSASFEKTEAEINEMFKENDKYKYEKIC